jgi:hypothetical protein
MSNVLRVAEDQPADGMYEDRITETVVPQATRTGGSVGTKNPYPEIKYRLMEDDHVKEERVLTDLKNKSPLQTSPEVAAPTAPAQGGVDVSAIVAALTKAGIQQPAPVAPLIAEPKQEVPVTFTGSFGEVTAPFAAAYDGELCVALRQAEGAAFTYNPPVNDQEEIMIKWRQGNQQRTQRVLHAGLTFKDDDGALLLVLLKAGV